MAKSRQKARSTKGRKGPETRARRSAPKRRVSTRRVSTRRVSAARKAKRPRGAEIAAEATAAAAAEALQVTFDLRDVAGKPVRDPATFFTFRQLTGNRQLGDQLLVELAATPVDFSIPPATGDVLVCEFDPQRYRFATSPVFFGSPGPPITRVSQLLREPDEWTPRFTRWADLPPAFEPLKDVLRRSPLVTLFKEVDPIAELLSEAAYDAMAGEPVTLAKTALLNIYFRLNRAAEPVSETRSWFSFVQRLLEIGRERLLAFVDPEMHALVAQIHAHIEHFSADYERTPAENHRGNVPASMRARIESMISIKSTHRKGNFQLTLSRLTDPDQVLLDADIDESGDLLGHVLDLFKHKVTGGTHPHDIHELLVLQEGTGEGFDLGYRLE